MSDKITCPKCGSDQLSANKKGFSGTKAVAGAVLTGGIGLLAGTIGSNQVKVTCMACGNSWLPKEYAEQKQQADDQKLVADLTIWKSMFFSKYESGNMDEAKEYYKTNTKLSENIPDFHEGYKHLKSGDTQMAGVGIFIIALIIGAFIFFVYLIAKC